MVLWYIEKMKKILNYLGFLLFYSSFNRSVKKQLKDQNKALFDIHDLDMKIPKDKRNFNHLIKTLIDSNVVFVDFSKNKKNIIIKEAA